MTEEQYLSISRPYREDERKKRRLNRMNTAITRAVYVEYPAMALYLLIRSDRRLIRFLLVPAAAFAAVSVFRRLVNAKRPYEVWKIRPLIEKHTKGKSFPSRHIFSIYMIAMASLWICVPIGVILLAAGIFLAYARVVSGVHFTKDVCAGVLIGIGIGLAGFFLI